MSFDFHEFIKRKNNDKQFEDAFEKVPKDFDFFDNEEVLIQSSFILTTAIMNLLMEKGIITQEELKKMVLQTVQAIAEKEDDDE